VSKNAVIIKIGIITVVHFGFFLNTAKARMIRFRGSIFIPRLYLWPVHLFGIVKARMIRFWRSFLSRIFNFEAFWDGN
jgi:hypothetical protein